MKYSDYSDVLDSNLMDNTTKLQLLAMKKDVKQDDIKELIKRGADIHWNDDAPLRDAAGYGSKETVMTLLEHGADIHARDDYALRSAAKAGNTETVKTLLEHGANIHAEHGEALTLAAEHGHRETAKTLLEKGADIHSRLDGALIMASKNNHRDVVNLLVVDYNMPVSKDTMEILEKINCQYAIDTINKRDLNLKLNSNQKTKQDKSFKMKI